MQTGKNCGMIIEGIGEKLPNRAEIIEIINETRRIIFPGYFGNENTVYCRNISIKGQTRI